MPHGLQRKSLLMCRSALPMPLCVCVCVCVCIPICIHIPYLLLLLSHFSHVRLCDPMDGSPLGSPVPGILQARTLEWVAISFSNAGKWKVKVKSLSHVQLLVTPWPAAYQAPLSMGFSRQGYWSGVPLPSPYLLELCKEGLTWEILMSKQISFH